MKKKKKKNITSFASSHPALSRNMLRRLQELFKNKASKFSTRGDKWPKVRTDSMTREMKGSTSGCFFTLKICSTTKTHDNYVVEISTMTISTSILHMEYPSS
jgi:hypothetical protein